MSLAFPTSSSYVARLRVRGVFFIVRDARDLIAGEDLREVAVARIDVGASEDLIKSGGYVLDAFRAALL